MLVAQTVTTTLDAIIHQTWTHHIGRRRRSERSADDMDICTYTVDTYQYNRLLSPNLYSVTEVPKRKLHLIKMLWN